MLGVDVSKYQQPLAIDWSMMKELDNVRFVIIKFTEGQGYIDPAARDHAGRVSEAGLDWGPYHFARPDTIGTLEDAKREATDFCVATMRVCQDLGKAPDLIPSLDVEAAIAKGGVRMRDWVLQWTETVIESGFRQVCLYCSDSWLHTVIPGTDSTLEALLTARPMPLWIASYDYEPARYDVWQKTDKGRFKGTHMLLDTNWAPRGLDRLRSGKN